jgi:hypothetical protein
MPSTENQMSLRARAVRIACAVSCFIAAASLPGCSCPPPSEIDQVFLLDATGGSPAIDGDGGATPADASARPSADCTGAAAGCLPNADCAAACQCVFARDQIQHVGLLVSCMLLGGAGPPAIEARYQLVDQCGE